VSNKYSIHAEQDCISKCKNKALLKYCILVLVRLNNNNEPVKCCPCAQCQRLINKYRIRKVVVYYLDV